MKVRTMVLVWLCWVILILGFQTVVKARFGPQSPDYATVWTANETTPETNQRMYLREPVMNNQVAWDSEYYLAIAVEGYDSQNAPDAFIEGRQYSVSYAFFPLYPILMRYVSVPFQVFGMNPVAAASLAGVLISAAGALFGMLGLYFLAKDHLGTEGGFRTAFYLLIFPTSFFLVQVYTEGLFVGLTFSSLALLKYKKLAWACILAGAAVLTRAVGVALLLPILFEIVKGFDIKNIKFDKMLLKKLAASSWILIPAVVFVLWKFSYNAKVFEIIDSNYFSRFLFRFRDSYMAWGNALQTAFSSSVQSSVYYILELAAILLGISSCIILLKKHTTLPCSDF